MTLCNVSPYCTCIQHDGNGPDGSDFGLQFQLEFSSDESPHSSYCIFSLNHRVIDVILERQSGMTTRYFTLVVQLTSSSAMSMLSSGLFLFSLKNTAWVFSTLRLNFHIVHHSSILSAPALPICIWIRWQCQMHRGPS